MTLDEQLEELRRNMLRDTSDLVAGDADELWSDETLLRYIKDAERRFARRTMMLRDSTTTEVVQVRLRTGVSTYKLHESVFGVLSARYNTDAYDLARSGHSLVYQGVPNEFLGFDPSSASAESPGAPRMYYTDETTVFQRNAAVTLTVYPAPSATENNLIIYLRAIRHPTCGYTLDDLDKESEIPEDYQLDVLEWAAYRALRGFDAEAGAPNEADRHKLAFEEAVRRGRNEMMRSTHVNTTVSCGGYGFSWTR